MKMSAGKVVDGKVVVGGREWVEGSMVLVREEDDEPVELTAEQQAELEAASVDITLGNFVTRAALFDILTCDQLTAHRSL
jgi:hypothetical protein